MAINHHQNTLEYIWLVHSVKSEEIARKLKETRETPKCRVVLVLIHEFENPLEYFNKLKAIYAHPPPELGVEDIILDFTGMSKVGSVGSVLASREFNAPLQYTPADYNEDGSPRGSRSPIEISLKEKDFDSEPVGTCEPVSQEGHQKKMED